MTFDYSATEKNRKIIELSSIVSRYRFDSPPDATIDDNPRRCRNRAKFERSSACLLYRLVIIRNRFNSLTIAVCYEAVTHMKEFPGTVESGQFRARIRTHSSKGRPIK